MGKRWLLKCSQNDNRMENEIYTQKHTRLASKRVLANVSEFQHVLGRGGEKGFYMGKDWLLKCSQNENKMENEIYSQKPTRLASERVLANVSKF